MCAAQLPIRRTEAGGWNRSGRCNKRVHALCVIRATNHSSKQSSTCDDEFCNDRKAFRRSVVPLSQEQLVCVLDLRLVVLDFTVTCLLICLHINDVKMHFQPERN